MFDGSERNTPETLADLKQAAASSLAETHEIIRRYKAASRALQRTMSRSSQLREESAALRAAIERVNPDGALPGVRPRRLESS